MERVDTDTGIPRVTRGGSTRAEQVDALDTEEISLLLDEPLPQRPRRRRLFGLALLFLLLVVCAAAVGGAWWIAFRDAQANDFGMANAERVIEDAEAVFVETANSDGARLHVDARCYLSHRGDPSEVSGLVRCGPVLRYDGSEDAPWDTVALTFEDDGDTVRGVVGSVTETGVSLSPTEILARPDELSPPSNLARFGVPDPPPLGAAARIVVDIDEAEIEFAPIDEGLVRGPDWSLHVEGVRRARKLGSGAGRMVAADGEELVAASLRLQDPELAQAATVTLVVNGERQPFALWGELDDTERAAVVSVPQGAGQVSLEISQAGVVQEVSMLDGRRALGYPTDLYRDPSDGTPTTSIDETHRFGEDVASGAPAGASGAGGSLSLRVRSATAGPWARLPDGTLRGAPGGSSFLALDLGDVQVSPATCPGPDAPSAPGVDAPVEPSGPAPAWIVDWASSFSLTPTVVVPADPDVVDEDDEQALDGPVSGDDHETTTLETRPPVAAQVQGGSGRVLFEVPEGIEGGILEIAPRAGCGLVVGVPGASPAPPLGAKRAEFSFPD